MEWRCQQISALLRRIADRIREARPDLELYVHAFPGDESRRFTAVDTPTSRLRDAGLDPAQIGHLTGVHLIDSSASYGRNIPDAVGKGLFDAVRQPALIEYLEPGGGSGRYISGHRYIEATETVIPPERLGFPTTTRATWASLAANPPGRSALERFAAELAFGDAVMLGDGGNGAVFSAPDLRDFLADFTRLPAQPFEQRTEPGAPVVVRTLVTGASGWLYAVNTTNNAASLDLTVEGGGTVEPLRSNVALSVSGSRLTVTLKPFEVVAARFPATSRITRISARRSAANASPRNRSE